MISLSTRQAAKSFRQKHINVSHSLLLSQCNFCGWWRKWSVSYRFQRIISGGCVCRGANVILFCLLPPILGVSCNRLGQHSCLRCKVRRTSRSHSEGSLLCPNHYEHVYLLLRLHWAFSCKATTILSAHITNCLCNPRLLTDETESNENPPLTFCCFYLSPRQEMSLACSKQTNWN